MTCACDAMIGMWIGKLIGSPSLALDIARTRLMFQVLFVCTGNLCRSPLALAAFESLVRRRGLDNRFGAASAGTHVRQHRGQRADTRAVAAVRRRGHADLSAHKARQISDKDFHRFDLIAAADEGVLEYLQRICPRELHYKLRLLMGFAPEEMARNIPDPYYGNAQGFDHALDLCEVGVAGLLDAFLQGSLAAGPQL